MGSGINIFCGPVPEGHRMVTVFHPHRGDGFELIEPLQYSWASLVAQLVKNPPAMRESWVRSLGWQDPLEKGNATQSRTPA